MAQILSLSEAVSAVVHDGDTVAMEGFTHLIPVAAGHEVIRQRKRDMTLVRMTPDIIYDQLIGAGCGRKLIIFLGWQPGSRLVAPIPGRGPTRLAATAGNRGTFPRGHGEPLCGRRRRASFRSAARLFRHRSGRPDRHHRDDHLSFSGEKNSPPYEHSIPTRRSFTRSARTEPGTSSCGACQESRKRPCWPRNARW